MSRIPKAVAEAVHERAGGRCECCAMALHGEVAMHHRRARGMGGHSTNLDLPENLMLVLGDHHRLIHARPRLSRELGHIVPSWANFLDIPVLLRGPADLSQTRRVS